MRRPTAAGIALAVALTLAACDPASPDEGIGDGLYEVGRQIEPGTYVTRSDYDSTTGCYWARLSESDGSPGAIIASDNLEPGERGTVVVKSTDQFVEFRFGCTWRAAS